MADSYDDKIQTMLVARRRMAEQKKAERQKELQKQLAIIGGALIALILVIVLIFKGCSADKDTNDKKNKTPVETTVEMTTAEEITTVVEETTESADALSGKKMFTTDVLNFRTEPTTESEMIRHIPKGAKVTVVAVEGEWVNITYKKQSGYVMMQYLSETKPE